LRDSGSRTCDLIAPFKTLTVIHQGRRSLGCPGSLIARGRLEVCIGVRIHRLRIGSFTLESTATESSDASGLLESETQSPAHQLQDVAV